MPLQHQEPKRPGTQLNDQQSRPVEAKGHNVGYSIAAIAAVERPTEASSRLITLEGNIRERPVQILVDSGALGNFLSADAAERCGLVVDADSRELITLPDGSCITSTGVVEAPLSIGTFRCIVRALVAPLPNFDVILGQKWHQESRVVTDWGTLQFRLYDSQNRVHVVLPGQAVATVEADEYLGALEASGDAPWEHPVELVSKAKIAKAFKRSVKAGETQFLGVLRRVPTVYGVNHHVPNPLSALQEGERTLAPRASIDGLQPVLDEYEGVFAEDIPADERPEDIPAVRHASENLINTGDQAPINERAFYLSAAKLEEQAKQIRGLLEKGHIRESSSPWGFPVLFVPKSDGSLRMCVDFRALNNVTARNSYPLPRIQECLDALGDASVFSKIDLTGGYNQIRLQAKDVKKTAFNTREGKFEYLVMPFGLKNAPSEFQTIVNGIMREYLNVFVVVYLDDILIYSANPTEHIQHVKKVLVLLHEHKLYAKPKKCLFGADEVEFCGHIVGKGRVRPLPQKLDAIKDWPRPNTVTELRSFTGLCSYYRRYSKDFARVSAPLFDLMKGCPSKAQGKTVLQWNVACQHAFERVKELLCSAPALKQPDTTKQFHIETDASDFAIGVVLMQKSEEDGKMHPVAYDGRKLNTAEMKYPVHEKELLAIKHALRAWKHYVDNNHQTTVLTDHATLQFLPTTKIASRRLDRWIAEFQEYDLAIKYRPGAENTIADAISRRPDFLNAIAQHNQSRLEEGDALYYNLGLYLQGQDYDKKYEGKIQSLKRGFFHQDGHLFKRRRHGPPVYYIITPLRQETLQRVHDELSHLGAEGLIGPVQHRYWWPNLERDVRSFVRSCPECQLASSRGLATERELRQLMGNEKLQPFERWGIDLIGLLPTTPGNKRWIVTAVDYSTSWPAARALEYAHAELIADFIYEEIFLKFGAPREIITDNGTNLVARVNKRLYADMGSRHRCTTAFHPRTNGKVESFNGLIGRLLTKMLIGKPTRLWDEYLPAALFSARVRSHSTQRMSPFFLVYGVEPRLPSDELEARAQDIPIEDPTKRLERLHESRITARGRAHKTAVKEKNRFDSKVLEHELKVGDYVLVNVPNPYKFEAKWYGPLRISNRAALGTYEVTRPDGKQVKVLLHGNRLKKALLRGEGDGDRFWLAPEYRKRQEQELKERLQDATPEAIEEIERSVEEEYMTPPDWYTASAQEDPSQPMEAYERAAAPPPPVSTQ